MELFHTLNRGVDKRTIFLDDRDRFRFIHDLFEFNDENRVEARNLFNKAVRSDNLSDIACQKDYRPRKLLVDIHCFSLMPNHYHLLLSPRVENGISLFMKKLNMGYAKYFNQRYKRTGALFEGRYKSVPIVQEPHFIHIPYYIHLNPLDLCNPEWREKKIKSVSNALNFLSDYRWSSYLDYIGQKNFPSVTNRSFLLNFYGGEKKYKSQLTDWIKDLDYQSIKSVTLE